MYTIYRNYATEMFETKINNLDPVSAEIVRQAALDLKESMYDENFKDLIDNKSKLYEMLKTYVPGEWEFIPFPECLKYNESFFYFSDICRIILRKELYSD